MYDVAAGGYEGRKVGVYSTEGMMKRAASSDAKNFVVATETGILHRMRESKIPIKLSWQLQTRPNVNT